jgi:hypothetical protein
MEHLFGFFVVLIYYTWPYIIGLLVAGWFFYSVDEIVTATRRTAYSTEMSHHCLAELVMQVRKREVERLGAEAVERELREFHRNQKAGRAA